MVQEDILSVRRILETGDLERAENACRQLAEDSDGASAWKLLGEICRSRGHVDRSVACFERAGQLLPDDAETFNGLGVSLAQLGQHDKAVQCFHRAAELDPSYPQAVFNLGVASALSGCADEAVQRFRRALELRPDYVEALGALGNVLSGKGEHAEAVTAFRRALELQPGSAEILNGIGLPLISVGRSPEAIVYLRQATRIDPGLHTAFNNLGLALTDAGRYPEAETAYERALELNPSYSDAHANLGNLYKEQARQSEALACYDLATWLDPSSVTAKWNRSLALLQKGDYERGWKEYEWRWSRKNACVQKFRQPSWDGSPLQGRTVLLYCEQGLGDTLQFVRYARLVRERGCRVILAAPQPLMNLLSHCEGVDDLVLESDPLPDFDFHLPLMSLPRVLETTLTTVPARVPYIQLPEVEVASQASLLQKGDWVNVGISWQGNPHHQWDRHRSIPLDAFRRISEIQRVRLVSLQRGPGVEQIASRGRDFPLLEVLPTDIPDHLAFTCLAGLIKNLDLVITVDTAIAHLAGALAAPVWTLLSTMVDWRWLLDRTDSPWYPTMRLFRQRSRGDWSGVLDQVRDALTLLVEGARPRRAE